MGKPCTNCVDATKFNKDAECFTIGSDNVIYTGPPLPCSNVQTHDNFTEALQKLDAIICTLGAPQNLQSVLVTGNIATDIGAKFVSTVTPLIYTEILNDQVTSGKFIVIGGTSTDFLKGDGSLDPNTYALDSTVIHNTGNEIKVGNLTVNAIIKAGGLVTEYLMADGSVSTTATIIADIIAQTIVDGDITHAPSGNAVFDALALKADDALVIHNFGNETKTGNLTVNSIIRAGGLATQFLKADGSIDSTTYQPILTNPITGTGTVNRLPKFGTPTGLVDSNISDTGILISLLTNTSVTGNVTATSFIKSGGLVTQFLKADGSVDSNTYALDSSVLHTFGNETFNGRKTGTNGAGKQLFLLGNNGVVESGTTAANATPAFYGYTNNAQPVYTAVELIGGTGDYFQAIGTDANIKYRIDLLGNVTAASYIKTGGLSTQYLMANGSVSTISNFIAPTIVDGDLTHAPDGNSVFDALALKANDANVIHTTGNEVKTGNLTVDAIIKSGGLVTQYLKADGSVSTDANIVMPASQVTAVPHVDYLIAPTVQGQLDNTETTVVSLAKVDKINFKDIYQTGRVRIDTDASVVTISPANTLNITLVDDILFVNEIIINTNANKLADFLLSFGTRVFVASGANTPLAANTRGVFYLGINKLGTPVYQLAKVYDQDVCYLARVIIENLAGVYTIISFKYFPDLANNRVNNRDRTVLSSGYIVPSGAASISFGNRGVTFGKNSINYSNNKFDPNFLSVVDSVNPAPMQFLFALPNLTSLATSIALSTVLNPTQWYTAGGTVGGGAVGGANYQVYKLMVTVTGTIVIQTKASTSNAPAPGVNAIFANRDDALAGLTSTVFPDILPIGDSIGLGTFYLRAGTAANGSQMNDPNDFYFRPFVATSSSSTVGVTDHDLLSNKNVNPAFQHVTTGDIANWNIAYNNRIAALTTTGSSGAATLIANTLNVPAYTLAGLGGQPLLTNPVTGTGTAGQVAFWTGTNSQAGDSGFTWDNTNKIIETRVIRQKNDLNAPISFKGSYFDGFGSGSKIDVIDYVYGSGSHNLVMNGVVRSTMLTNGNFGIGIASPSENLHVVGNGLFQTSTPSWATNAAGLMISGSDSGGTSYISAYLDSSILQIGAGTTQKTGIIINGQSSVLGSTIQFSTGGSEKVRILSNGNVGIGTSTPTSIGGYKSLVLNDATGSFYELQVAGTSALRLFSDSTRNYLYDDRNVPLAFFTTGTEKMRILGDGNVGIGTTTPYVIGSYTVTTTNGTLGGGTMFQSAGTNALRMLSLDTQSNIIEFRNMPLILGSNGAGAITILGNKDVGIGTGSPTSGGGAARWLTIEGDTTYGGGMISSLSGVAKAYYYYDSGFATVTAAANAGVKLITNGGTNALSALSNGNVLIGHSSEYARLTVGSAVNYGAFGPSTTISAMSTTADGGAGVFSVGGYSGNASTPWQYGSIGGGKSSALGDGLYGGYLNFYTSSSGENGEANSASYERMRIDKTGLVNIVRGDIQAALTTLRSRYFLVPSGASRWVKLFTNSSDNFGNIRIELSLTSNTSVDAISIQIEAGYYDMTINNGNRPFVEVTHQTYNPRLSEIMVIKEAGSFHAVYLLINAGDQNVNLYWNLNTVDHTVNVINALASPANNTGSFVLPTSAYIKANNFGYVQLNNGNICLGTNSSIHRLDINTPIVPAVDTFSGLHLQAGDYGYVLEGGLKQNSGGELKFLRNQAGTKVEFFRMDVFGNFGIGTPTPTEKLAVRQTNTSASAIRADSPNTNYNATLFYGTTLDTTGGYDFIGMYAGGVPKFNVNALGNVIAGAVTATGFFTSSDARLKEVVRKDGDVAYFKWKDGRDDKEHIGYIAQEVQESKPDQVQEGKDGMLTVNYIEILVEKIRILEKEIEALKNR